MAVAAVAAAAGGAVTWSTDSGAPASLVAAVAAEVVVLRGDDGRTNRVVAAVEAVVPCYCGVLRTPRPATWPPRTRAAPQNIASAIADVRATGHVRSCPPPTPNTWPPRPRTP